MEENRVMQLIMASANENKIREISQMLPAGIELLSLSDIGFYDEIEETGKTLNENALIKVRTIYLSKFCNCFGEDTGLEIDALNKEPGVYSARYAGPQRSSDDNMNLVLERLSNIKDRRARFRTVLALILDKKEYLFEGIVEGHIIEEKRGTAGFGYDPIFVPNGYDRTFAEMDSVEKNRISHRGQAVRKFIEFLKTYS